MQKVKKKTKNKNKTNKKGGRGFSQGGFVAS